MSDPDTDASSAINDKHLLEPENLELGHGQSGPVQSPTSTDESSTDDSATDVFSNKSKASMSKNKLRKLKNREQYLINRTLKRIKEREIRKQKKLKKSLGNDEKLAISEKLKNALNNAPRVVVDCQYDFRMSHKERNRLAQQLRRCYSSNKSTEIPLHLIFTSLPENSEFFQICCKQNDGFQNYVVDRTEKSVKDMFPCNDIIYLSPDSDVELTEFNPEKVYVIGGLVDETIEKNISLTFSNSNNIQTARLPIDKYFMAEKGSGTGKKVLAVNQVFDIILKYYETKDWVKAISAGLAQRTGFVPKLTN